MKRPNILFACILLSAFVLGLTGLTLADTAVDENGAGGDHLIGVFVTPEYLDLFDIEQYLNDNAGKLVGGGELTMDGDTAPYERRLYATLTEETLTNEETGETITSHDFVFEGVEGCCFFAATIPFEDGHDSYITTGSDDAISDSTFGISCTDNGTDYNMEGTIYVTPTIGNVAWYCNPVYQTADGRVYATSGSGTSASGHRQEGGIYSATLTDTQETTVNGESTTNKTSVKISFSIMYPPEQIRVIQFDQDSNPVANEQFAPGDMPQDLVPGPNTAYIIAETLKTDYEGNKTVTRELFQKDDGILQTYFARDDGICVCQATNLLWAE